MKKFFKKSLDKNTIKKIIIIIFILILIIILINIIKYFQEQKYINQVLNTKYTEYEDFKTAKEYIIYSGNTYIKEVESSENDFYKDIYMKFKYDLYTNGNSNQYFYERTIKIIANTLNYNNFRLIDDEKKLVITVFCEDDSVKSIYYNGDKNYFEKTNSIETMQNVKEIQVTDLNIQSKIINDAISNNWYFVKMNFGQRTETKEEYEIYSNEGIRVKNINKKIFNIVFLENYKSKIVNDLTVTSSKEEIIETLGKPTFEDYGIIGYKGKNIYIFFGNDYVSVYRIEEDTDGYDKFLEIQKEFRKEKNVKSLISELVDLWDDFDKYEVKSNYVNIIYSLRGIKVQINVTNENGFIFYNNYIGKMDDNLDIFNFKELNRDLPEYTYVYATKDLVEECEIERATIFEDIIL